MIFVLDSLHMKSTIDNPIPLNVGKGRNDSNRNLDRRRDDRDRGQRRDLDHRDQRSPRNDRNDDRRRSGISCFASSYSIFEAYILMLTLAYFSDSRKYHI